MKSCTIFFVLLIITSISFAGTYSGGDGSSANPYQIANPEDLLALAADTNDYNDCFILINDINLAGYSFTKALIAPDTNFSSNGFQGTSFIGTFDGNGHSIISLTIDTNDVSNHYLGLFGVIDSNSIIKNLGIEDVNITDNIGSDYTGGLCGINFGGSIASCHSTGNVSGKDGIGGLCGYNYEASITNCYSTCNVNGNSGHIGGLCGDNTRSSITNSYSTGNISGMVETGGLCGTNYGSITNCYSTGAVSGGIDTGGLCGASNTGSISNSGITNCYSSGNVAGTINTGGLCGDNYDIITNCYSTGNVSGSNNIDTGGLCGDNSGNINSCYFLNTAGPDNGYGEPLMDVQMKQQASFMGWDFVGETVNGTNDIWWMPTNGYPRLVEKYSGGEGTAGNPYKIANPNDLLVLAADANDYNDCFILINDINLAGLTFNTAVIARDTDLSPGGFDGTPFTGVFDGNDHSILNLTIDAKDSYIGLFGQLGQDGLVKNLGIEDVNINLIAGYSSDYVGGLCGYNYHGSIINCYSAGALAGNYYGAGGLCGYNRYGTITDCFSSIVVNGGWNAGGLCGMNVFGSIVNCYSTGNVSGNNNTGGLCGHTQDSNISSCFSTGKVTGDSTTGGLCGAISDSNITNCYSTGLVSGNNNTGGLCGWNYYGNIIKCYSTGAVDGNVDNGGLCGESYQGNITNCYSTGNVAGSDYDTGGLCGSSYYGGITNCYSTGEVTGVELTGGLCGGGSYSDFISCYFLDTAGPDNGAGEPLTDSQMKQQASFINWDFEYLDGDRAEWFIQIDEYPILTWQISPADFYMDGENNFKDWAVFAQYWLIEDCTMSNYYCERADMDFDGHVDVDDLAEFMSYWLEKYINPK